MLGFLGSAGAAGVAGIARLHAGNPNSCLYSVGNPTIMASLVSPHVPYWPSIAIQKACGTSAIDVFDRTSTEGRFLSVAGITVIAPDVLQVRRDRFNLTSSVQCHASNIHAARTLPWTSLP